MTWSRLCCFLALALKLAQPARRGLRGGRSAAGACGYGPGAGGGRRKDEPRGLHLLAWSGQAGPRAKRLARSAGPAEVPISDFSPPVTAPARLMLSLAQLAGRGAALAAAAGRPGVGSAFAHGCRLGAAQRAPVGRRSLGGGVLFSRLRSCEEDWLLREHLALPGAGARAAGGAGAEPQGSWVVGRARRSLFMKAHPQQPRPGSGVGEVWQAAKARIFRALLV